MSQTFTASGIDFQFICQFNPSTVWTTADDPYGDIPGSFWDPTLSDTSFKPFGNLCVGQTEDPSGSFALLVARISSSAPSDALPPLAAPVGFTQFWNDHGTANCHSGACWLINPPDGYVALGSVFNNNNYESPDVADYWCVRQDLVQNLGQPTTIWIDQGSRAKGGNLGCFGSASTTVPASPANPGTSAPTGSWVLSSGSFIISSSYTPPKTYLSVLCLPNVGAEHPGPGSQPPALTAGSNVPPKSSTALAATIDVPFPLIADPGQNLAWQVANPIYTIEIWGNWNYISSASNYNSLADPLTAKIQTGIETNSQQEWSDNLGVSADVSASGKVGFLGTGTKVSVGITGSFSHTWAGCDGLVASTSTSVSITGNIPANSFGVIWQITYDSYLRRADGSYVPLPAKSSTPGKHPLNINTQNYAVETVSLTTGETHTESSELAL